MTNIRIAITSPNTFKYDGWRVLHGAEGGYNNPTGMPAVRPAYDAEIPVQMTEAVQLMSYALNGGRITKAKWRALYGSTVAFTNNQSWPEKVCRDYVNRLDLNAVNEYGNPSLPKLLKGIICGGMFVRGEKITDDKGTWLLVTPGIGAIDARKPIPDLDTILKNNWYFQGTTSGDKVYNLLPSDGQAKLIPYLLMEPTRYPFEWFERWKSNELPDPMRIYNGTN